MRRLLVLLALVGCRDQPSKLDYIAPPAATPAPSAPLVFDVAAIDAWVAGQVAERGAVGVSLVVVRDGKVALANGYGKQRTGGGDAVTADTVFALGSLSKQFACTVAYMLVDRGKLAMTDAVAKWYPQLTRAADVTLADLGGHTSGYRDYYPLDYVDERMTKPIAPDELIARYASLPLDFEPGARYSYSNTGFVILARVVEKAAGTPYHQLLADWIFEPLGMAASVARPARAASGHVAFLAEDSRPAPLEAEGWLLGAADIWASANDLAKWDLAVTEGKLLSPASQRAIATARTLTSGRSAGYSCGFGVRTVNGETVLSHTGWVGGYATYNAIVPRTKSAVVLLSNDEHVALGDVADRVLHLVTYEAAAPAIPGPPPEQAAHDLIVELQRGTLDRGKLGDDFSAYLDDARVRAHAATLRALGEPSVTLTSRRERGGMELSSLVVAFPTKTFTGSMFRSTDGKIRQLLLSL